MGEMISMIAHQWRQPLNLISTGIQNLKYDYLDGNLQSEEFVKEFIEKNKKTIKAATITKDSRDSEKTSGENERGDTEAC